MNKDFIKKNVYFVTGGKTGGHIYPALCVALALKNDENNEVFFVGNPKNFEYEIALKNNLNFLPVKINAMPRKFCMKFIFWGLQVFISSIIATFYILKYKPKVIFGTGGYVSAPCLIAANLFLKTPYMIHDCDSIPGVVSRYFSKNAKFVSIAFEEAKKFFRNPNVKLNGNPIRKEFKQLSKKLSREELALYDKLTLIVMGGSQGAIGINKNFVPIIKTLSQNFDLQIIFQTGKKNYDEVIKNLQKVYPQFETDTNLHIKPYFEDMPKVLIASDIAISRAGSLSISEIMASKIASILVPYPYSAAEHQFKNALSVERTGSGICIEEKNLSSEKLFDLRKDLIINKEKLLQMQNYAENNAKYNSTEIIVEQLKSII